MITQLLNRQFVLEQLEQVQNHMQRALEGGRRAGPTAEPVEGLEKEDYEEAIDLIEDARQQERQSSSGQPGYEVAPSGRRDEPPPEIDDVSFFSRNAVVSNLQSALEEYFEEREPEAIQQSGPTGRRSRSDDEVIVTDREIIGAGERSTSKGRRLFEKFSVTDIGWVSSLVAMGIRKFRNKHAFNRNPAPPRAIAERARIVLVGDWGSGLPRAQKVSDEMKKILREGEASGIQQHVIHLGDVYYSGWKKEYQKRFLPYWPVDDSQKGTISSWSLNANHDMYSGGHDYFGTLLKDPRFRGHSDSSFFSLANSNWRILGLDTGWEDGGLQEPQPKWVRQQAEEAERDGQMVMLLSHHQLFSVFEAGNPYLAALLEDTLNRGLIHSWIWGHEHRCILHAPHENLQFSACLGNGGVPVYMTHKEDSPLPHPATYEYRARIKRGLESWALCGFAVLDLDWDHFSIRLIDENGTEHHSENHGVLEELMSEEEVRSNGEQTSVEIPENGGDSSTDGETFLGGRRGGPPRRGRRRCMRRRAQGGRRGGPPGRGRRRFARRRAAEPSEGDRSETVTVRRTPHLDVSATDPVPPDEEFDVLVYADQQKARAGERSEDIVVDLPEDVIELDVKTQLLVSPHFKVIGSDVDSLAIDRTKAETEKIPFKVQVRSVEELTEEAGNLPSVSRGSITALFHYEGRPSGKVSRIVPVDFPLDIPDGPSVHEVSGASRLQIEPQATQPDLLIEIHAEPINDGRQFRCKVSSPSIEGEDDEWVPWNLPSVAKEIVNGHMENFVVEDATPLERLSSLEGAGIDLFSAAPENFKRLFWQLIDGGKVPKSIAIVSEEPYVPWELMIPHRRKDGKLQRRKPLGVEFTIGRWTPDNGASGRQSLALDSSLVIAPKYKGSRKLPYAQEEAEYMENEIGGTVIRPAKLENIDQTLSGKKTSVLHFTCHGAESTKVSQVIYLEDDRTLDSSQLLALEGFLSLFEDSNTMVVLNACEVGRPSPALVGVGGFAKAFIDLGASAVVAALWSVKDDLAHEVMLEFYEKALADPVRSFADILREIRARSYESKDDVEDTYAAYCFYGDPLAKRAS